MTTEAPPAPASAEAPASPAPAAPEAPKRDLPLPTTTKKLTGELVRGVLAEGYRGQSARRQSRRAQTQAAQVDTAAPKADTEPQQPQTPPLAPAAAAPAKPAEASPARDTPAKADAAPASEAQGTTALASQAPVLTEAPPVDRPAPDAQPEAKAARELPPEYRTVEIEALSREDRFLERSLRSIWFDPNLSPVQKVQKMDQRVARTKDTAGDAARDAAEDAALWESEDFGTLKERYTARRAKSQLTAEAASEATNVLAWALDVDPNDDGFLSAGAGLPPEARSRAFASWAAQNSPILREAFTAQSADLTSTFEKRIADLEAKHAQTLKDLEARHKVALEATAEESRSKEMGRSPSPPRATSITPADASVPFRPPPRADAHGASVLTRELFSQAFRQKRN